MSEKMKMTGGGVAFPRRAMMSRDSEPAGGTAPPATPPATPAPATPVPTPNNAGASNQGAANPPPSDEPRFTQADIDRAVTERLAREKRAGEEKVKAAEEAATRKQLAEQGQYKELLDRERADAARALQEVKEQAEAMTARANGLEIERQLERACAKSINPAQVAALLRGSVTLDAATGKVSVIGDNGVAKLDPQTGQPITLARHAEMWLSANPHFLPASNRNGGGSTPSNGGGATGGVTFDKSRAHDIEHVKAAAPDIERQRLEQLRQKGAG